MNGIGRRLSALFVVTVVATAMLGAAHTLWYENLKISAQVSATELDGQIRCGAVSDNEDLDEWQWPPPPSNVFPPHTQYPHGPLLGPGGTLKDVATGPVSSNPSPPDFHEWSIVVGNAYPGFAFDCEVELRNNAPLPWHVETMAITVEECELPGGPCVVVDAWELECGVGGYGCEWGDLGINPPNYPDGLDEWSPIYATIESFLGCQVHQGQIKSSSLFIGVNQSAKENTRYVITLSYQVNQWNESGWYGCGRDNPNRDGPVVPE